MLNKYDKRGLARLLFLLIVFFFGSSSAIAGKTHQEKEYIEEHVDDIDRWGRVSHPVFTGFVLDMKRDYFLDFFKKRILDHERWRYMCYEDFLVLIAAPFCNQWDCQELLVDFEDSGSGLKSWLRELSAIAVEQESESNKETVLGTIHAILYLFKKIGDTETVYSLLSGYWKEKVEDSRGCWQGEKEEKAFKKKMREVMKIYKNTALHHTSDNEYFACHDYSVSQGRCAGVKNYGENEAQHSQSAGDSFGVDPGGALAGYGISTGGAMGKKTMLASGVTVLKFFGNAPPKGKSHPGAKGSKSKPWPPGEIGKLDDLSKNLK